MRFSYGWFWAASAALAAFACGGSGNGSGNDSGSGADSDSGSDAAGTGGTSGGISLDAGEGGAGTGSTGGGEVCREAESDTDGLRPVYLAFVFDVSGSMGKLDQPRWWHDPAKKWLPVTEATEAFFAEESSNGLFASLTLFPRLEDRCDDGTYLEPEVPFVGLPSSAFASALDDYEEEVGSPLAGGDWRGGTPTLAAFDGTIAMLEAAREETPNGRFVVVLVTDGMPQDCSGVDIDDVAASVEAAREAGIATYVVGVENPTTPPASLPSGWDEWGCGDGEGTPCEPPANLSALNQIAVAGGTEAAFLISTEDPEATKTAFAAAIDSIRDASVSCEIEIPVNPQTGGGFEPDFIQPTLSLGGVEVPLAYDPTCSEADSWRFDDEEAPRNIVLCESTCGELAGAEDARFAIEFLCEPRIELR